jgi:hypothetical protein
VRRLLEIERIKSFAAIRVSVTRVRDVGDPFCCLISEWFFVFFDFAFDERMEKERFGFFAGERTASFGVDIFILG